MGELNFAKPETGSGRVGPEDGCDDALGRVTVASEQGCINNQDGGLSDGQRSSDEAAEKEMSPHGRVSGDEHNRELFNEHSTAVRGRGEKSNRMNQMVMR